MPSRLNQLILEELKRKFRDTDTCFFVDPTGLDGRRAADLRHHLRSTCGDTAALTVVRTSLFRRSFDDAGGMAPVAEGAVDASLAGPTAVAYGGDDPFLLVRTLADWARSPRNNGMLRFKGGVLAGQALGADAVSALAKIPPKPILMGQVIGMIAAPLTSLLSVSQGVIRKLLGLIDALAAKSSTEQSD